jgi:hypothetical protein
MAIHRYFCTSKCFSFHYEVWYLTV